jgi:hypothetical protein
MKLPAISIKQPWAYSILKQGKDVENRTWPIPRKFCNRKVLLHTGKTLDKRGYALLASHYLMPPASALHKGGIVGWAIFDWKYTASPHSKWTEPDMCWWHILDSGELPFFPCPGHLGFFNVDYPYEVLP